MKYIFYQDTTSFLRAFSTCKPWQLLTPRIGEQVKLNERQTFSKWWR